MGRFLFISSICVSFLLSQGSGYVFAGKPEAGLVADGASPPAYDAVDEAGSAESGSAPAMISPSVVSTPLLEPWTALHPARFVGDENTAYFSEMRLAVAEYLHTAAGNFLGADLTIQDLKDLAEAKKSFQEMWSSHPEIEQFVKNLVAKSPLLARFKIEQEKFDPQSYGPLKEKRSFAFLRGHYQGATCLFRSATSWVQAVKSYRFRRLVQLKPSIREFPVLSIPEAVGFLSIYEESEQKKIFKYLLKHGKVIKNLNSYSLKQVLILTQHLHPATVKSLLKSFSYDVTELEVLDAIGERDLEPLKYFLGNSPPALKYQATRVAQKLELNQLIRVQELFPELNLEIIRILQSNQTPQLQLNGLYNYFGQSRSISDLDFYFILKHLPQGVDHGWDKTFWGSLQIGFGGRWLVGESRFQLDVEILYRSLLAVSVIVNPDRFRESVTLVDQFIMKSHGFGNFYPGFQAEVYGQFHALHREKMEGAFYSRFKSF